MLTMCGKAYRRIFDAENMYTAERRPPTNYARYYIHDHEQRAHGETLGISGDTIDSLRSMLNEHNSWVQTHRSAVDEIVRNDHDILDAQICFGPVNRGTHGPILGELPSTSEIAACIFQESTAQLFRQVYTFPRNSDSGRPRFVPIFSATYEPLGYPLLFFSGTAGWSKGTWIPGEGLVGVTVGPTGKKVPLANYVRQRLLSEPVFHQLSRVTQEYLCDMYSRYEEQSTSLATLMQRTPTTRTRTPMTRISPTRMPMTRNPPSGIPINALMGVGSKPKGETNVFVGA